MKRAIPLLVLILFLCSCAKKEETTETDKGPVAKKVKTTTLTPGTVQKKITLDAVLEAERDVVIATQAGGVVTEQTFDIGTRFAAGDTIAVIDPAPKKAAVEQAQTAVEQAQAALDLREKSFARDTALFEAKGLSQEMYEASETSLKTARLAVKQTETALSLAQISLDYSFVRAPFAGTAASRLIQKGQTVAPGTPVTRLVDTDSLQIVIALSWQDMTRLTAEKKKPATITLPDGTTGNADIRGIAGAPDKMTALYPVKLTVKGRAGLLPGTPVKVSLPTGMFPNSFEVDRSWLKLRNSRYLLFSVEKTAVKEREVLLRADSGNRFIVSFLDQTTAPVQAVIVGQEALSDGQQIEVLPE